MIAAGCNSWRNWEDIDCGWSSLVQIIDHWGEFGPELAHWAGPGHWCGAPDPARACMPSVYGTLYTPFWGGGRWGVGGFADTCPLFRQFGAHT